MYSVRVLQGLTFRPYMGFDLQMRKPGLSWMNVSLVLIQPRRSTPYLTSHYPVSTANAFLRVRGIVQEVDFCAFMYSYERYDVTFQRREVCSQYNEEDE